VQKYILKDNLLLGPCIHYQMYNFIYLCTKNKIIQKPTFKTPSGLLLYIIKKLRTSTQFKKFVVNYLQIRHNFWLCNFIFSATNLFGSCHNFQYLCFFNFRKDFYKGCAFFLKNQNDKRSIRSRYHHNLSI
jgi:hypothetical protein